MLTAALLTISALTVVGLLSFIHVNQPPAVFNPNVGQLLKEDLPEETTSAQPDATEDYYKTFTPTKGEVWPRPYHEVKLRSFYTYTPKCNIKVVNKNCELLVRAIYRYIEEMKRMDGYLTTPRLPSRIYLNKGKMEFLLINLTSPCESFPHVGMNEEYVLSITETARLNADSVWGVIRGLESLTQLFYYDDDFTELRINATHLTDRPEYSHRGVLVDTARHYISMDKIYRILDAMAMNKMNVFHWHIVDDESFAYQSEKYPELSEKGAFDPFMVYTPEQITNIVEYARDRGIRVYPEFNVPAHSQSLSVSHPELVISCYASPNPEKKTFLLHPLKKETYKLLWTLFREAQGVFVDTYFHLGGDEVKSYCWSIFHDTKEYLDKTGGNADQLYLHFMKKAFLLLGDKRTPIVWEDVFDAMPDLANEAIIQVSKFGWIDKMAKILNGSHRLILSSPWMLNHLESTFTDMYYQVPRGMMKYLVPHGKLGNIIGGEACVWTHDIDDSSIMTTMWPRAMAVAEALWSSAEEAAPRRETLWRAQEHIVRMRRRTLSTGPFY